MSLSSLAGLAPGPVSGAHAAPITVTSAQVAIDHTTAAVNTRVETTFSGCVPDSAATGDSFTLVLPAEITSWDPAFTIYSGAVPALSVTIDDSGSPAVATFTLTQQGAAQANLCFRAWFGGLLTGAAAGQHTLSYSMGGTLLTSVPITVTASGPGMNGGPVSPEKYGQFESADNCRTTAYDCLSWYFKLPMGDQGIIKVTDPARSGWSWVCDKSEFQLNTYDATEVAPPTFGPWTKVTASSSPVSLSCTPQKLVLTVDTTGNGPSQAFIVYVDASADSAIEFGGVTFVNEATTTITSVDTVTRNEMISSYVGGSAAGDSVLIRKDDTAGHAADVEADAVELATGSTSLRIQVTNNGSTSLTGIEVSDVVHVGSAAASGLTCNFSLAATGAPTAGTAWDGPWPIGRTFICTATLSGVSGSHRDTATVTATGNGPVQSSNDYWARKPPPPAIDLTLSKTVGAGPYAVGEEATFTLTPHNIGPGSAAAGWSVTERLPTGLTATSMSGPGYTCLLANLRCTATGSLAAGADGGPITVRAKIDQVVGTVRNLSWVAPAPGEVPEDNPLVIPPADADTSTTATNNDAQAELQILPAPSPSPSTSPRPSPPPTTPGSGGSLGPTPTPHLTTSPGRGPSGNDAPPRRRTCRSPDRFSTRCWS